MIQNAVDSFQVPNLIKGSKREYYKMGAVAMAKHVAVAAKPEYDALCEVAEMAGQEHGVVGISYNKGCPICNALKSLAAIRAKEAK